MFGIIDGSSSFQGGHYNGSAINVFNNNIWHTSPDDITPFNYTCFPAGTKIKARRRRKDGTYEELDLEIEKLNIGDEVLSWNGEELEWKPIEQVFERENNKLIKVKLANNAVLEPTPEHPFYVQNEWIAAESLKVGMKLLQSDLSEIEIIKIEQITLEKPIKVYNLEVQDNHNYFVSGASQDASEGVLVHNDYDKQDGKLQSQSGKDTMVVLSGSVIYDGNSSGLSGQIQNQDEQYRQALSQTLDDLIEITNNNSNLSMASRLAYTSNLIQAKNQLALYNQAQLQQFSNPVYQKIASTILQIQNEQLQSAINSGLFFDNERANLTASKDLINQIVHNIQNTVPDGQDKQELINKWKSLENQLSMAETGAGLFDTGLSTAGGVAVLAGGIVALSSGTAAAGTIATLSQTPSGRQMLANWFSQALKSELEAINVDPFLQSLYGEVLKAENGIQKAAELMVFNGLVLKGFFGLGFEFITSSSSLKPATNLIGTIDESLESFSNSERALAEVLTKEGYNVQAIPRSSVDGTRTPDAIVHNLATDVSYTVEFKTLQSGATSNTVKDAVNKSLKGEGQARNIIVDARDSGLTKEEAVRALNRVGGITRDKLDQLRIVGDNFDLTYKYTP